MFLTYLNRKRLAKEHMDRMVSQPCYWHKSIFNWRHVTCNEGKVAKCIASASNKIRKRNNNNTTHQGKKHAYLQGAGWETVEVEDIREKSGTKSNVTKKRQAYETKNNSNVAKIAGRLRNVFQMNKAEEISNFQNHQTKF